MSMKRTDSSHHNIPPRVIQTSSTGVQKDNDYYQSIGEIRNKTKPGEMLEFQHGSYTHYALYLGKGKVMNIDAEDGKSNEAQVRECSLRDVCDDAKVRASNHEDVAQDHFQLTARPPKDIVRTARSFANKVVPFEFNFRNCEYYCTLWRYGKGFSTQVARKGSATPKQEAKAGETSEKDKSVEVFEDDGYATYKQLSNK